MKGLDQFRFLGNCPPTPPLTQHFALSEKYVIMLTWERGRWKVSQKPKMTQTIFFTCLKYFSEYWYMESTSAMLATTKYITEPLVATGRYFSRARVIFSSVISASFSRVLITPEVTWGEKTNGKLGHIKSKKNS